MELLIPCQYLFCKVLTVKSDVEMEENMHLVLEYVVGVDYGLPIEGVAEIFGVWHA